MDKEDLIDDFFEYLKKVHPRIKVRKTAETYINDAFHAATIIDKSKIDYEKIINKKEISENFMKIQEPYFNKDNKTTPSVRAKQNLDSLKYFIDYLKDEKSTLKDEEKISLALNKLELCIQKYIRKQSKIIAKNDKEVSAKKKENHLKQQKPKNDKNNLNLNTEKQKYTTIISDYIDITLVHLLTYINRVFVKLSNNWWKIFIINKLKGDDLVKVKRDGNLEDLDLVALINLIIDNWENIKQNCSFTSDDLNTVYNMKKVRCRKAHKSNKGYKTLNDIDRDFDYILRFLELINIDQENINNDIKRLRKKRRELRDIMNYFEDLNE